MLVFELGKKRRERPFQYQHQKIMRVGGTPCKTRCAGIQYRVSIRILLVPSTANAFLIPNFILWIHITVSNVRQEDSWKQNNIGRNYIGIIIIITIIKMWIKLAFTSLKNLCGIISMIICHMTAHRVTERKVGVRNRADSRNFAVIDFRALSRGRGVGATPGVVSVRFHCGPGGRSWGVPPILRVAELDDCAAVVQYMSDCRSCRCVTVCSACWHVFVLVLCTGNQDSRIKPVVVWRTMLLSTYVYW